MKNKSYYHLSLSLLAKGSRSREEIYLTTSEGTNEILDLQPRLTQLPSLTLGLEQSKHITLTDGSNYVADDRAGGVIKELDAHLRALTAGSGAAKNLCYPCELLSTFL